MMHTSIFVNDMAESIEFYTAKLGLTLLRPPSATADGRHFAFVGKSWDAYIELVDEHRERAVYELGSRFEHLAMDIPGPLDDAVRELERQGVVVLQPPKTSPGGNRRVAFVRDPNGIPIELMEPRDPAKR